MTKRSKGRRARGTEIRDADAELQAFLASSEADLAADYASHGPRLRDLPDDALVERLKDAARGVAADIHSPEHRRDFDDSMSEMSLRGLKPPSLRRHRRHDGDADTAGGSAS
jgi:hypothetical protein